MPLSDLQPAILSHMSALVLAGACLVALAIAHITVLRLGRADVADYHRKPILSPWERQAILQLQRQLPPELYLCPQVRLAELLAIENSDRKSQLRALNRVASKSVDFVVIEIATGDPRLVIELDDRTHKRGDRQRRDAFVDDILRQAGIRLVRFQPFKSLDIRPHLGPENATKPGVRVAGA